MTRRLRLVDEERQREELMACLRWADQQREARVRRQRARWALLAIVAFIATWLVVALSL